MQNSGAPTDAQSVGESNDLDAPETAKSDYTPELQAKNPKHPLTWVPSLYFAEGLPNVVTVIVSVLMYKSLGLTDADIALFTSLITYPWVLKPLWSPFLELFRSKKRIVIATQFFGGVGFGCLALAIPADGFLSITLAIFALIAFNSATHDIVADGVYVSIMSDSGRAKYIGIQGAGYNIARFLSQGVFVWVAGKLELKLGVAPAWMVVMGLFGITMLLLALLHARTMPDSQGGSRGGKTLSDALKEFLVVWKTFFRKENVWWAIAFIVLYRFSEGNQVKIVPLFMRAAREDGGLGLSTAEVGVAYGMVGAAAFVLGSFLGGIVVARRGLKRSRMLLAAMFNLPNAVYASLAFAQPESFWVVCGGVWLETFGYGFGFVAVILFMMQELAPGPYKMAHYAFGTAVMFLGFLLPSTFSGYISDALGYKNHFLFVIAATIPSFLVTYFVPFKHEPERSAAATA